MALRIRPYNTLQEYADYMGWYNFAGAFSESDYSFPSGHTTAAFEMATALFLVFPKQRQKENLLAFPGYCRAYNVQPCVLNGSLSNGCSCRNACRYSCRRDWLLPYEALYEADY